LFNNTQQHVKGLIDELDIAEEHQNAIPELLENIEALSKSYSTYLCKGYSTREIKKYMAEAGEQQKKVLRNKSSEEHEVKNWLLANIDCYVSVMIDNIEIMRQIK
jgi:hypothetical protein